MLIIDTTLGAQAQVPWYQIMGAAQYSIVAIIVRPSGNIISRYNYFQISVVALIFLSLGLQLHDDAVLIAGGIAYTVALIATIVVLSLIFTMPTDAVARCLGG